MAAKRLFEESSSDSDDQPITNRSQTRPRPSLAPPVIGEAVTGNFLQSFCSVLEPMLRRVVTEEVANGLQHYTRSLTRSPSLQIQSQEPPTLKLIFTKNPSLQIFTGTKILDLDNNPLQILVVNPRADHQMIPTITNLSSPIKVEIVVLDGDFPRGDCNTWTTEEFDRNMVRERTGKRPLLAGDLNFTMREGFASVGDIEFTDNSSWIRGRKFRLGARIVQGSGQGVKIKEAMTQPFVVKDHRGELYKKHHPPALEDEVWRLEKIGKDGVFHKKLNSQGINSVQDFLKLSIVDPFKLRRILGAGMSEKVWEVTLKHARTCVMGRKFYIFRGPNHHIILNPICQVVKAVINGQTYTNQDLTSVNRGGYIENLAREAYSNWSSLQEIDGLLHQTPLLTQGELVDQYSIHHHSNITTYQQHSFSTDASMEMGPSIPNNNWGLSSTYISTPSENGMLYNFSESSSDGDIAPH